MKYKLLVIFVFFFILMTSYMTLKWKNNHYSHDNTENKSKLTNTTQLSLNASHQLLMSSVENINAKYKFPDKIYEMGLNLIFFSDQYESFEAFENDVNMLMNELRQVEPWKSYDRYNVYLIYPKDVGICYVKIKDERKPVLRCREGINSYLHKIPVDRFRLIVLSRQDFQSWANVVRIRNGGIFYSIPKSPTNERERLLHRILFAHLMGHAFGLKDEELYSISKGDSPKIPNGPNCVPDIETAKIFWGDLAKKYPDEVGYFYGCAGSETYVKPTNSSLMNLNSGTLSLTYGKVSEDYLRKILLYCFTPGTIRLALLDGKFFSLYPEFRVCIDEQNNI